VSQANLSKSRGKGTIRGMHYQVPGIHEAKIVRCIRGSVWDVVVDMRERSPTKFQHLAYELSDANGLALCIPDGVAHGHQALNDEADLFYLMDGSYQTGHEAGLRFDDPAIGIDWPLPVNRISPRDLAWPLLCLE
jgi:dTDP-4-dehydrorhamnose 3,5-epimerase